MSTNSAPDFIPAVRCITLDGSQQPKDVVWNYQTPQNITKSITFPATNVATTDSIWGRSNAICYSTDHNERIVPPLHTAEESTTFLLWHGVFISGIVFLFCVIYNRRIVAQAVKKSTLSTDRLASKVIAADDRLRQLSTAKTQRDEMVKQNEELLEEHAMQELRFNEVDDAKTRSEKEVANVKNELRAANERRKKEVDQLKNELRAADEQAAKDREEDDEWDVKFDDMIRESNKLKADVAALMKELAAEKNKPCNCVSSNTETQTAIDCIVVEDMDNAEKKNLQEDVARLTAEISELRQESTAVNAQLRKSLDKASADHKAEKEMLTKGMAVVVSTEKKALQDEIARLTAVNEKLQNDLDGWATEKKATQNEIDLLVGEKNQCQDDLKEADAAREDLQKEVETLTEQNEELKENAKSLSKYIDKLHDASSSAAPADAELQQSLDDAAVENEKLQNDLNSLFDEKNELQGALCKATEGIKTPQGFLKERNKKIKELQNDVEQLNTENQALRDNSVEAKESGDLMARISDLESQLASADDKVFTQEEYDRVQNELLEVNKKAMNLQGDYDASNSQFDSIQRELQSTQKKLESATEELNSKTEELSSVQRELQIEKGNSASLQAAVDGKKFAMESAQQTQADNMETIEQLQKRLEAMKKILKEKTKEQETNSAALLGLTKHAVVVSDLEHKIEQLEAERKRKEAECQEHLWTCNGISINADKEDDDMSGDQRNELLEELEVAKNDKVTAEAYGQELENKLFLLEQQLSSTRADGDTKIQELDRLGKEVKKVDKLHVGILNRNKKIKQLEDDLKTAKNATEGKKVEVDFAFSEGEGSMDGMEEISSDNGWYEEQNHAERDEPEAGVMPMRSRSPSFDEEDYSQRSSDFERTGTYSAEEIYEGFMNDPTGDFLQRPQGWQQPAEDWGVEKMHACDNCGQDVYDNLKEEHLQVCKGGVANDPDWDISLV